LDPDLSIDVYARMETGEPQVVELGERVRLIRCLCGDPDRYVPKEEFWDGPMEQFTDEVVRYAAENSLSYDLVHGHYADGWDVAHRLGQRWGVPYCLTTHSLGKRKRANCVAMGEATEAELDAKYAFPPRIASEEAALRDATRILPLTEEEGVYIREHYPGVRDEQFLAVPNGVVLSEFYPRDEARAAELRKSLGIGEDELVVFQAGRVDRRKGQKELLSAAPRVIAEAERAGKKVRFVLVGWTGGDFAESLEQGVRDAGITDRVTFIAPVSGTEMAPYFWMADVYALTSTYDILPIVLLEAMANRLPVVASKNGGPSEVVATGEDGILVDPFDAEEVEGSLIRVLVDDDLRQKLGAAAFQKIEARYTWERVGERLNQIYAEMVGERMR